MLAAVYSYSRKHKSKHIWKFDKFMGKTLFHRSVIQCDVFIKHLILF